MIRPCLQQHSLSHISACKELRNIGLVMYRHQDDNQPNLPNYNTMIKTKCVFPFWGHNSLTYVFYQFFKIIHSHSGPRETYPKGCSHIQTLNRLRNTSSNVCYKKLDFMGHLVRINLTVVCLNLKTGPRRDGDQNFI